MPPRKGTPSRNRAALIAVNAMAVKVAKAQGHDWPVTLTLRGREKRKVRGRIEARSIDPSRGFQLNDGESNLLVRIAGESIPLERIVSIARQRVAPEAG